MYGWWDSIRDLDGDAWIATLLILGSIVSLAAFILG
jgi:hypothetical protein